ncbi:MAG: hypothetical protein M5U28_49180 [Sandaracinaceae bacterium]|nr:hypothetical protein [Sandaracinaceae bacterium]
MVLVALTALAAPLSASAQTYARRRVPQGEVTGLEMGIEGGLAIVPGGRLRWYVTLYEVVRRRDLRVSAGSVVRATASFAREEPVSEVTTDADGRAVVEFAIPEDLETAPHLMLEATSPRNVRRVFEVDLELEPRHAVELFVDRDVVPPGATVVAFGRVIDRARGAPSADHEVTLRANARGPLGPPIRVRTDAAGVFSAPIALSGSDNANVQAIIEGHNATVGIAVRAPERERLSVAARPRQPIVTPGGPSITVEVLVRTPDGAPVEGAQVEWQDQVGRPEEERSIAHTGADGRAELLRPVPRWIDEPWADHAWQVRAVHPAYGMREVPVHVRVARQQVFARVAVEGGALVPGLTGRVLVRLTGPDGLAIADRAIELDVPRLGGRLTATTDRDGVAVVEGTVGEPLAGERCGGPTAAAAEVVVGNVREHLCLAVDPDAMLALRAAAVETSRRARVEVLRRASVARAPVVVDALARIGERWAPVATGMLAASERSIELELPAGIAGEVWLRARPVLDGPRQVRGGGVLAWVGPAPSGIAVAADARAARVEGAGAEETLAVFALEPERADALLAHLGGMLGPVGAAIDAHATDARVRMLLAARTPRDEAVSAVLRDGEIVPLPLPEEPARLGLLRDPWRTRARFVRGRIGRIMRAVEDYVAAQVPGSLEDVAVRGRAATSGRARSSRRRCRPPASAGRARRRSTGSRSTSRLCARWIPRSPTTTSRAASRASGSGAWRGCCASSCAIDSSTARGRAAAIRRSTSSRCWRRTTSPGTRSRIARTSSTRGATRSRSGLPAAARASPSSSRCPAGSSSARVPTAASAPATTSPTRSRACCPPPASTPRRRARTRCSRA